MTEINLSVPLARLLKGAPLACLFVLLCSDAPVRAGEMRLASGYSANSVTAALRLLAELGLAQRAGEGWRLADGLAESLLRAPSRRSPPEELKTGVNHPASASNRAANPSGGGENLLNPSKDSPPPGTGQAQIEAAGFDSSPAAVERILEATALLFGERVHGPPDRYGDARLLLACIAETYARRHTLNKPARVVYANMKRGVLPAAHFRRDPLAGLPPGFLAAAGLPQPVSQMPVSQITDPPQPDTDECPEEPIGSGSAELAEADDAPPLADHPSLALPVDGEGSRSAAQAWLAAREILQRELPRHIFAKWVESCLLSRYDPQQCVFDFTAADELQARWLDDRLRRRLEHLLAGVCGRQVTARFHPPAPADADSER